MVACTLSQSTGVCKTKHVGLVSARSTDGLHHCPLHLQHQHLHLQHQHLQPDLHLLTPFQITVGKGIHCYDTVEAHSCVDNSEIHS